MSQFQIKVPDHFDITSLSKWAANCIYEGVPREIISYALLSHRPADKDLKKLEAVNQVEHSISRDMTFRNQRGSELEKSGSVDQAISLYERNAEDWFSGEAPYDRLRIIYTKRGQVSEAVRVCEAFVRMAEELIALGSPRGDLPIKRDRFTGYARKIKKIMGSHKGLKVFIIVLVLAGILLVGIYSLWAGALFGKRLPEYALEQFQTFTPLPSETGEANTPGSMYAGPAPEETPSPRAVTRNPVCGQRDPMIILALGIDEVELADVIRLVRIDFVEKRILVLSIPRAFWVPIPGLSSNAITQGMLNWTYGLGEYYNGPGQGVVEISRTIYANYGVKFDRYLVMHFDNFVQVVDAVGGVDISLDEPIGNYGYYGRLHFNGEQALDYARLREFDNDHYRIKRQSGILDSLYLKMIQPENLGKLPLLGARFLADKSILTDLSLQDLYTFTCLASNLTGDSLVFKDIPPEFYKGVMQYGRNIIIPAPGATTFIQDMIINGEY